MSDIEYDENRGMPGMVKLLGVEVLFGDFRRALRIDEAINFAKGIDSDQIAEINKVEPGLIDAIVRAKRKMGNLRLMCTRIVVKGKKLKPFCDGYFDPLPFEYVEEF